MTRKSNSPRDSLLSLFDDDELEVCEILLQMPRIIFESENRSHFLFNWGVRKRRSAIDPSLSLPSIPSSSSSYLPGTCVGPTCENDDSIRNVEASSPTTPLSFPSESDGKCMRPKTSVSYKKKKEDWLKMVERLTYQKELLKTEIENVEQFYNTLKALNSELKAKKQQLNHNTAIAEARVESKERVHPQQPLPLLHHSAQTSALVPSTAGSDVANLTGRVIPDLNVPLEEILDQT